MALSLQGSKYPSRSPLALIKIMPEDITCIDRQQSRDGLQESGLARAIRADQTKNFTAPDIKRNISECPLLAVPLGYAGNL